MNRKLISATAMLLLLAGCNGKPAGEAGTKITPTEKPFKVALLTPGSISDAGWNAMAYEGLQAIKQEVGAEVNNQEATDAQIRDAMRSYAQNGYQLVLGHGYEYNAPGVEVAKDFPDTVFVSSSGDKIAKNAGAFRFYLEQGFYLAGYMAASMSKSGKLAMIGFNQIPSIKSTFRGFAAGARAAKPNIKLIEPDLPMSADLAAFRQATEAAIREGADFVIHQANQNAQGVFDVCKEKKAWAFGANANQNDNPSGVVVASAVIVAKPAYVALARSVKEGTYQGNVQLMGMDIGSIDFALNPALKGSLPAGLEAKLDSLKEDIKSGKLVVPKDEF